MDYNRRIKIMIKAKIGAILEKVNMGDGYADIDNLADEIYNMIQPRQTYEEILKEFAENIKQEMTDRDLMGIKYKWGCFSDNDIDELVYKFITNKQKEDNSYGK